jgi:hypothetical protein
MNKNHNNQTKLLYSLWYHSQVTIHCGSVAIASIVATAWRPSEIRQVRSYFRAAAVVRLRSASPAIVVLASALVAPNHLRSMSHEVTSPSVACRADSLSRVLDITGEFAFLMFVYFLFFP